jgi:hypothetical protein
MVRIVRNMVNPAMEPSVGRADSRVPELQWSKWRGTHMQKVSAVAALVYVKLV